jgi:5-methylcytosine-specific restriction endonuclease McrA
MLNKNVLVLNRSYEPLTVCKARRAVVLTYLTKAEVLVSYNGKQVRSIRESLPLPSVIRLTNFIKLPRKEIPLTRRNILRRDGHRCQYCGKSEGPMTTDHIIPKVLGGKETWENMVCACVQCNARKGNQTLKAAGMTLLRRPRRPSYFSSILSALGEPPEEWRPYLFLD